MIKVYVVVRIDEENISEYGSRSDSVIGVCSSIEKAKQFVVDYIIKQKHAELIGMLLDEHLTDEEKDCERDEIESFYTLPDDGHEYEERKTGLWFGFYDNGHEWASIEIEGFEMD